MTARAPINMLYQIDTKSGKRSHRTIIALQSTTRKEQAQLASVSHGNGAVIVTGPLGMFRGKH